jgi:hypothetical protein
MDAQCDTAYRKYTLHDGDDNFPVPTHKPDNPSAGLQPVNFQRVFPNEEVPWLHSKGAEGEGQGTQWAVRGEEGNF